MELLEHLIRQDYQIILRANHEPMWCGGLRPMTCRIYSPGCQAWDGFGDTALEAFHNCVDRMIS